MAYKLSLLLSLIFTSINLLNANTCFRPSILTSFSECDEIFVGTAILIDSTNVNYIKSRDSTKIFHIYGIQVKEKYKGSKSNYFTLTPLSIDSDFRTFDPDEEYLFYAKYFQDSTQIRIGDCSRSTAKQSNRKMRTYNIKSNFQSDLDSLKILNPNPISATSETETLKHLFLAVSFLILTILIVTSYNFIYSKSPS